MADETLGEAIQASEASLAGEAGSAAGAAPEGQTTDLPALEAPSSWKQEFRETFGKLAGDPNLRPYAEKWNQHWTTEQEITRKLQSERDRYQSTAQRWEQTIAPYQQFLHMNNMSGEAALNSALAWHHALAQSPKEALFRLAQQYGVDLAGEVQRQVEGEPYVDPLTKQLQQELQEIRGSFSQQQQFAQQQQHAQLTQHFAQHLNAFATAVDADGKPKAPYLNDVWDEFQRLVLSGYQPEKAYQLACHATDGVVAKMEADRKKAEQEVTLKKAADDRAKAERAENATRASGKSKGTAATANKPVSLRKTIEEAQASLESR